jgi:hypothetical protein
MTLGLWIWGGSAAHFELELESNLAFAEQRLKIKLIF